MMTKMVFKVLSKEWSQRHMVDQDLRQRVNQDDQHTKRTRCTERDQVIPWYGKHCPLRICVLTHGLRESSMWGQVCLHGLASRGRSHTTHEG